MKQTESDDYSARGLRGSLAFRVLLIESLFLLIPLLIFSGALYYEESRLKAENTLINLTLILEAQQRAIQNVIENQKQWLIYLSRASLNSSNALEHLKSGVPSLRFFHLTQGEGGYICDQSAEPQLLGKNFSALLEKNLNHPHHLLIEDKNSHFFYLFQTGVHGREMWGVRFSNVWLRDKLTLKGYPSDLATVSLLSKQGIVFLSTDPNWQGIQLHVKLDQKGEFSLTSKATKGLVAQVANSSFLLGVTLPKKVSLVDPSHFFAKMAVLFFMILTLGGGLTYFLTLRLSRPLKHLCLIMKRVRSSDLSARYQIDQMGFEINIVGSVFNSTITSLLDSFQRAERERLAKEVLQRELMIGQAVQASILPSELPPFPGLDIAVRFISAKEVGGDFYDVLTFPKPRQHLLFFSIADTAGKGIDACLYSLSVRSMLRSYAQEGLDLDTIIQKTNHLFCLDTGDTGVFVTAWLGIFNQNTRVLTFSNCGHFPAYLMREDQSFETLTSRGMALGVQPFDCVETKTAKLSKGDVLLLVTDGMIEARNHESQMLGGKKLIQWLAHKRDLNARQIVEELIQELASFTRGLPQQDDLTLLVCKVR